MPCVDLSQFFHDDFARFGAEELQADGPLYEAWDFPPANDNAAASNFSRAVRAAIAAYARTGKMLDAALAYAAHGIPVFPLTANKTPVPARDKDADGVPIPGTGSFKKATLDPIQIHKWWYRHEYLIGVPMGPASGVWILDVDSSEDHADGVKEWRKITAEHEPIVTRQHRSATDGPHLIFNWDEAMPLGCSSGALPDGIEVKGDGGYVAMPPSKRKGRAYTVYRDIDPTRAPAWLTDLIQQGRTFSSEPYSGQITAGYEEIADALSWIPNDDVSWAEWKFMGMRIFAATEGKGFALFDAWSRKSTKYNEAKTRIAWREIIGTPPTRTGAETIFRIARGYGWIQAYEPSYPEGDDDDGLIAARRKLSDHVNAFWQRAENYWSWLEELTEDDKKDFFGDTEPVPPVEAIRSDTGIGKTEEVVISFAGKRARGGDSVLAMRPLLYGVDRHKLGTAIEQRFTALGVEARVFRGRSAEDPDDPGHAMCRNPRAVALAVRTLADVNESACRRGKNKCPLFSSCAYQKQKEGDPPTVWVAAHDVLFHNQKAFGNLAAAIIDESMLQKGIRGIQREENEVEWIVPLASLIADKPYDVKTALGTRTLWRDKLGRALTRQSTNGGVQRKYLEQFDSTICRQVLKFEWEQIPKLGQHPGMSEAKLKRLENDRDTIDEIQFSRKVIRLWETIRELNYKGKIAVSGRLTLKKRNGQRVVEWKGVEKIRKQFQVPTLVLDATLPTKQLLQVYFPQVEIVADIKAATPSHVHVRQVLDSPTSSNKLDNEVHLEEVWRYILLRWLETGRQSSLVICQEKVEVWLRARGLPTNIKLAHYNDITGLDEYGHVRLLILIGRTAPGPRAMESLAGALTGAEPVQVAPGPNGFVWYPPVRRGIRLRDGSGIATTGDRHPDRIVEAIRWQIHEAQLIQARGRAREVNREPQEALDIDQVFDAALPLIVDQVTSWRPPTRLAVTAVEGVMLTSPGDLTKLWPKLWPNRLAATRTLKEGVPTLPGFESVPYQLKGPKMNRRVAYFDPALIPDPRAWLELRLGPLVPL